MTQKSNAEAVVINLVRIIVGVLFIFSGLVKANDPLGLSYKMQEFFEVWNEGLGKSSFFLGDFLVRIFTFLHEHSLALAIIMIAFEIIAGAALLLGWRMRLFSWLLLLLIVFFTFLTGYALLSGKFKNCGCFGDCIPITPRTSFLKDLVLLVLILYLFIRQRKIRSLFSPRVNALTMLAVTLFSFGIQWYVLTYLPFVDCLPYKKGNNISQQMKMPANAVPDSTVITFVYEKEGKKVEFTADKFPADFNPSTYKFISRYDKVIKKGKNNEPPIKGFVLTGSSGEDSTQIVLSQSYAYLLFCEKFSSPTPEWKDDFLRLHQEARAKNIPVYIITAQPRETAAIFAGTGIPIFTSDYKAILTAARTNPCLYLLKEGTIQNKWSYKKIGNAVNQLAKLPAQPIPAPQPAADSVKTDTTNQQPVTSNQ